MTAAALLARADELGFAVDVTPDGPRLVPVVAGAILPPRFREELGANREAIVRWLTCRVCGRETADSRDLVRLRCSTAFCDRAACPYKR